MVDRRCCWPVVVPSVLVWMGVIVANDLIVASTVFGFVFCYHGCRWGLVPLCMLWGCLLLWICWRPSLWIPKPCHCLMCCPHSSEMWRSPGMCLLILIVQIVFERELGDVFGIACAPICNLDLLCGGSQDGEVCIASVLFADVVSVGPRVICQYDTRVWIGIE